MRRIESHRPEHAFQMTRRPDVRTGRRDEADTDFGFLDPDSRTRQGVVPSPPFFNTAPRRMGPQQHLHSSPIEEPSRRSRRDQGPDRESWNPLGMQLQLQMKHLEKHREGSAARMDQQAEPDVTELLAAGYESQPFQNNSRTDQRQSTFTNSVNMPESPAHIATTPERSAGRNATIVDQQEGADMNAHEGDKESQLTQPSDETHPDKLSQALTASIYFRETETPKAGDANEHVQKPSPNSCPANLQQAFVSAHKAWVSLETELQLKKDELEQARKSMEENVSLINSLRVEHDSLKSQLHEKKNEQLKLEAVIVGLQGKTSFLEKQFEGLQNKLAYFYELQRRFNDQMLATGEECDAVQKCLKELKESYDENVNRLQTQGRQLGEEVVKLQEEIAIRESKLEVKTKAFAELSEKHAGLESKVAEAGECIQKMEQEKAKLEKDFQVLLEEHNSMLQEKQDVEEALHETQMQKESIVSHMEETRNILEQKINTEDDQGCPDVYQLDGNLAPAITVRRAVEKLILQCSACEDRLNEALNDIKLLQTENERLCGENKDLVEKTTAFVDIIAGKQDLELELAEERLRTTNLMEQLKEKEELLTSGLQKVCSSLQELKEESDNIIDELTTRFVECGNDMDALAAVLNSEMSARAALEEELENVKTEKSDLERRVIQLATEVEDKDRSLSRRKEEVDDLTGDVTNLRQLLETATCEIDNLTKSSALSATSTSEKIEELRAHLEQKSACAAHLSEKLQETEKLVTDLKEEVNASTAQVDQLRSANEAHLNTIRQLSADLEEIKLRPKMVNQEVQMSQTEENNQIKELRAKLQDAEDKFGVLEIDFNRLKYEKEVRCASYEERVQELQGKLQQANANYVRLEKELQNLKDKEYVQEQQRNSVAKQLQDMQTTNNIVMSNMKKEHDAAVQKLKNENADLQERLRDLTMCLEKSRAQAQEEKASLQKSRDQAHEEMKCLEAKLENEMSKKEELIDKLRRQLRTDELKHEEELMNLTDVVTAATDQKKATVVRGNRPKAVATRTPFITDPEQRRSPSPSPGTRRHSGTAAVKVVPLTLQPVEQAVQSDVQQTAKRPARRALRQAVQPVQTRRKCLPPVDIDNMFDSSNSSTDTSELTVAVDRALHTTVTQEEHQSVDTDDPEATSPKQSNKLSPTAQKPTADMPPPQESPAPKKRKFFKSQPEWNFSSSAFR